MILDRRETILIYYMMRPSQDFVRCRQAGGWATIFASLRGAGVIQDAASCHVSVVGMQLFPLLYGQTRFPLSVPSLYILELPPLTTEHELRTLEEIVEATDR
jgi:hypothetical protein